MNSTVPLRPSTMRTIVASSSRIGMKSISGGRTRRGVEDRLEHHGVADVAPLDPFDLGRRMEEPAPVLVATEQRREAGTPVEPGYAQPVDRTVARHQRDRFGVADDGVVLDER